MGVVGCEIMGGFFDFLRGKSQLKPNEVVKKLSQELATLNGQSSVTLLISDEDLNRLETYLAAACAGTTGNVYIKKQPKPEEIEKCLSNAISSDLLIHMARTVHILPAETRRIISAIWGYMLKLENPKSHSTSGLFQRPMVEYLGSHTQSIDSLFASYGTNPNGNGADVTVGVMIRDATRYQKMVQYILTKGLIFDLFPILTSKNFDVSSDAFQTMKEILVNHKEVSSPWLSSHFDQFFKEYMKLISQEGNSKVDYVLVRQCLSILSAILLDRKFMETMLQFVNQDVYLKEILMLLSNPSKVVQFEAFHIFKIFAANPKKTPKITKILHLNMERIVKILNQIDQDRLDDPEFKQDKIAVVAKLEAIDSPPKQ